MHASASIIAAVLALAPAVRAVGSANIYNWCDFKVYMWPISSDSSPSEPTVLDANSGFWSSEYQSCSSGGYSLKLSKSSDMGNQITQFEYTLDPDMLWYDISNVNCQGDDCPFSAHGMYLESGPDCATATCAGGLAICHDAYTLPDDNWASHGCGTSENTTLYLCSSSSTPPSGSSDSAGYIGVLSSALQPLVPSASSSASDTPSATPSEAPSETPSATPSATPSSSAEEVAAAAVAPTYPSSSSTPEPAPTSSPSTPSTTPSSTEASSTPTETSAAPVQTEYTYVTVTQIYSTEVVHVTARHEDFHKNKPKPRAARHPHARRHQHDE